MAHNPEVTGSNPVPATKKTEVRKGSAECGPLFVTEVRTNFKHQAHMKGAVASARVGAWVLDHEPDLRRWDKKIIGANPSSLGPIS